MPCDGDRYRGHCGDGYWPNVDPQRYPMKVKSRREVMIDQAASLSERLNALFDACVTSCRASSRESACTVTRPSMTEPGDVMRKNGEGVRRHIWDVRLTLMVTLPGRSRTIETPK